jgi:hypothetical protein
MLLTQCGSLSSVGRGAGHRKSFAEYRAKNITPKEKEILQSTVSDGGFHYLGSGKIMAGIGRGFAGALLQTFDK